MEFIVGNHYWFKPDADKIPFFMENKSIWTHVLITRSGAGLDKNRNVIWVPVVEFLEYSSEPYEGNDRLDPEMCFGEFREFIRPNY